MALEYWNWFLQLEGKGSLTKAAEDLHMTQQTLSARLASLEKEVGAQLVVRSTPLSLTPAGETFKAYAEEQDQARQDMLRRVDDAAGGGYGASGLLKVGVSHVRSLTLVPAALQEFHKGFPGVRVQLVEATNDELLNMVERREVDMVIARFERNHPGVRVSPLFREETVLAIHRTLLEELTNMDAESAVEIISREGLGLLRNCPFLLVTERDISGRIGRSELRAAKLKPQGLIISESTNTLLSMCAREMGAVFCPAGMVDHLSPLTDHLVRIPLSQQATYEISIGVPADAQPWTPAQTLEDIIGALYGGQ